MFYPIQAPCRLALVVHYFDDRGSRLPDGPAHTLVSPGGDAAVIDVTSQAPRGARTFRVHATPADGSRLPARISHQVIYGRGELAGSVNKSLEFADEQAIEASPERPFLSWIQGVHGDRKVTRIGVMAMRAEQERPCVVDCAIYDERGLVREQRLEIAPYCAQVIDSRELFGEPAGPDRYYFVYASALTARVRMYTVAECLESGHCSAEHNF